MRSLDGDKLNEINNYINIHSCLLTLLCVCESFNKYFF